MTLDAPASDLQSHTLLGLLQGDAEEQLAYILDTMREMSRQSDPQRMVQDYGARMRRALASDSSLSLSRRDLTRPRVRITRSSVLGPQVNPWESPELLPVLNGGLLSELIWGDQPIVIEDLQLDPADPGLPYLAGLRSLVAIPLFDQGTSLNMVVLGRRTPNGFSPHLLPQHVWMSNLFGQATHNLVLSQQVRKAYDALDREMRTVADIQRSLLPPQLPDIPTLAIAAHYQTSFRAGGDYYDFFPLPNGRWGILVADVSGHGTPAAVIMAVVHSIAHTHPGPPTDAAEMLSFLNDHLTARYTGGTGTFVTAFYGIYDPATRGLTYASAGHCPPRLRRGCAVTELGGSRYLPLGIEVGEAYASVSVQLEPRDALLIYTDGLSEARSAGGEFFGTESLDAVLLADDTGTADALLSATMQAVERFTSGAAPSDDRTLLAVKVK